jgi:hypothetical protein
LSSALQTGGSVQRVLRRSDVAKIAGYDLPVMNTHGARETCRKQALTANGW